MAVKIQLCTQSQILLLICKIFSCASFYMQILYIIGLDGLTLWSQISYCGLFDLILNELKVEFVIYLMKDHTLQISTSPYQHNSVQSGLCLYSWVE